MAIEVQLRDEFGGVLDAPLEAFLESNEIPWDDPRFPSLRWLDAYGNTTFGRVRMEVVLPELERFVTTLPKDRAQAILRLAKRCAREVHTYLVFHGD